MSDALLTPKITPEAMAIIKEGTPKPHTLLAPTIMVTAKPSVQESGEVSIPKPANKPTVLPKTKPQKDLSEETPNLVPFSIRLPEHLPLTLLKASSDRKLKRLQPYTNQAIVAEALTDWFKKHGYQG